MTASSPTSLERYLRHRRFFETAFWILFWLVQASANSLTVVVDIHRAHLSNIADWEPVVWEFSSCLMQLVLIPALLAWDRRRIDRLSGWRPILVWYLLGSLLYSLLHVLGMVGLRWLAYAQMGSRYDFGPWLRGFLYEYLKDVRSYFYLLATIYLYRLLLLRLQGEASLLQAPDVGPPAEPLDRPERFLVRKLGKEFLVNAVDIEWIEAEGNYANLHVRGRLYPLRSTMAALEPRLDPARFRRVHRSYIINLSQLAEIEPLDSGDAKLRLCDGTIVPCSRKYREILRSAAVSA